MWMYLFINHIQYTHAHVWENRLTSRTTRFSPRPSPATCTRACPPRSAASTCGAFGCDGRTRVLARSEIVSVHPCPYTRRRPPTHTRVHPSSAPSTHVHSDNHIGDAGLAALSALLGDGITPSTTTSDGGKEEAVEGGQCPLLEELHLGYNDVGPVGACVDVCVRVVACAAVCRDARVGGCTRSSPYIRTPHASTYTPTPHPTHTTHRPPRPLRRPPKRPPAPPAAPGAVRQQPAGGRGARLPGG